MVSERTFTSLVAQIAGAVLDTSLSYISMGVSFGEVALFEFSMTVGDSPFVTDGVPVRLDQLISKQFLSVDEFEKSRAFLRRKTCELRIPAKTRYAYLRFQGFQAQHLKEAANEAKEARQQVALAAEHAIRTRKTSKPCKRSPIRMPKPTVRRSINAPKVRTIEIAI